MVGENTRRVIPLVSATLTILGSVIAYKLTESLGNSQSLAIIGAWMVAGIIVTYSLSRLQARSQEESPEAIKERLSELEPHLRKQVQVRSYGARRNLIEAPLRELDLDITPRWGWVRDPRLAKPDPLSEKIADDIVAAFESSRRRLLIVGKPGSGKTMAAYSLIEYLDETEVHENEGKTEDITRRIPLLVNLSAWEAQDDFKAFLVEYLCSSVGYEVREHAVASAFISSDRYVLILDGLDEIPVELRAHFSEQFDTFVSGLPGEVGVIVTCRTQEYEELREAYPDDEGLGLVQAVEMLPLTPEQLDGAFVELAKLDEDWEAFLSQQHLTAYQRVRELLSTPLFLNLAVAGRLSPGQLLDWSTTEQELQDLVLDSYLDRTLADQRQYEPEAARRYLAWIASFLNGVEVSPFGLKETDYTVFDLADLTPPDPPRGYRSFVVLVWGLIWLPLFSLMYWPWWLFFGLCTVLNAGIIWEWFAVLRREWTSNRSALSSRLTFVWPLTRERRHDFLVRIGRRLFWTLVAGLVLGLIVSFVSSGEAQLGLRFGLAYGLSWALVLGLLVGLFLRLVKAGPFLGLLKTRHVLLTSRTPIKARAHSLIAALLHGLMTMLLFGLLLGLFWGLNLALYGQAQNLLWQLIVVELSYGLLLALIVRLPHGGWFVVLQKVAERRLARVGNLPPRPYDFLEWGIERQIFRRVGGGVRFRHNLIQQHLANTSEQAA
jgi:hypothetical protein